MYVKPYHSHDLNKVEALSTFVQILTIYAGQFVSNPFEVRIVSPSADIILILLWLVYVCYAVMIYLHLRIEILKWIIKNEWNGRFVSCMRTMLFGYVNTQEFRKKYMARGEQREIPVQRGEPDRGHKQ